MLLKCTGRAREAWITAATVLVFTGGYACGIFGDSARALLNPPGIQIDVVDAGSGTGLFRISANPTGFIVSGRVREPMTLVPPFMRVPPGWQHRIAEAAERKRRTGGAS